MSTKPNRYFYLIGDTVTHLEHPNLSGVITQLTSFNVESGEPTDSMDPTNPWYHIQWSDGNFGFESQSNLVPSFVDRSSTKILLKLHELDIELYKRVMNLVKQ